MGAAAAAVVLLVPRPESDGLRPKGRAAAALEVACVGGTLAACPRGATLVFSVALDPGHAGYLAAWAEPRAGGERIWYFSAETETPHVSGEAADTGDGVAVLKRGIRLGPEHAPGTYDVRLVVTAEPATRAALLGAGAPAPLGAAEFPLEVSTP